MAGIYHGWLRLAHSLGKHLHECLGWPGPVTHRQFMTWQAWLDLEDNRPSRSDHYAMQVACEVRRGNVREPSSVGLGHFKITFERRKPLTEADRGRMTALCKSRWFAAVGYNPRGG